MIGQDGSDVSNIGLVISGEQSPYGHCIARTPIRAANRCESLADTLEKMVERGEQPCERIVNRLRMIACDLRAMQKLLREAGRV